jgi:hypothetical protein
MDCLSNPGACCSRRLGSPSYGVRRHGKATVGYHAQDGGAALDGFGTEVLGQTFPISNLSGQRWLCYNQFTFPP